MPAVTAPKGLKAKAKRVWDQTTKDFELRADELRVLEDACREIDLIERMETALSSAELLVRGSQGQSVANPLVQELRQHRATVARLFSQLKLSDTGDAGAGEGGQRSATARDAANARWRAS